MTSPLTAFVPIPLLENLLSICMSQGGDWAEIYVEQSRTNYVSLEENIVRHGGCSLSMGVGIRVIAGSEVGYAYSDDLEPTALKKAASVAASIARSKTNATPIRVSAIDTPNYYPIDTEPDTVKLAQKADLLREGDAIAHQFDGRIKQVMGGFVDQTKDILIATSHGTLASDHQVMCRMNFTTIATDTNGESRTGFHGGGGRIGFDYFDGFSPTDVANEAARMAIAQLGAKDAPAGPQTVVLSPGWSGILLHEAVGHGLEADFIHKGTSLFAGKEGEQVASPLCTVIDDGGLSHKRGSINIDDEGCTAKEKVLIENGILRGYMVDELSARTMGIDSTGSGRRQSYKHAPMPRMTNTFMAAGPHNHDEIMASVENGIYCASFGGGQVDISNGNFVFEVREGYQIEHGKLTQPIKNATLIGVGPETLQKISMVGDNPELDPGIGTCGKDGQSVPVGVGMPTVRIDDLTVGGTGI